MTIMLAGGMTIAFPGFTPDAHAANANLIVSAENTGGYVDGAQVIEIVVIDEDISASPDITVNGDAVSMFESTDGNWYAYIVDREEALAVDNIANDNPSGIDFGNAGTIPHCGLVAGDTGATTVYCDTDQTVPAAAKDRDTANWPYIRS